MNLFSKVDGYRTNHLSVCCLPYDWSSKYSEIIVEYIVAANLVGFILGCLKPELWWRAQVFPEEIESAFLRLSYF